MMASLAPQQLPRHEVESSDSRKLLPAAHEVASPSTGESGSRLPSGLLAPAPAPFLLREEDMLSPAAVRADMADMDDLMTSICSPEPFGDHLISFPDLGNELPSEAKGELSAHPLAAAVADSGFAAPTHAAPAQSASGRGAARPGGRGYAPAQASPDFATIYAFIGTLFDPACEQVDHAGVLAQMPPVDRETAGLLMHNIIANLACPPALAEHLRVLRLAPHAPGQRL